MSAPALIWSRPPEYQPPLRLVPPDPDEFDFDDPTVPWHTPPTTLGVHPLPAPPPRDVPVWDEPGDVRDLMWRLLCLVLEALDGRRPITQLQGTLTPSTFESLRTRAQSAAARQHRLRTLHTCRPAPNVLELCATVTVSSGKLTKAIAIAARVEHARDRWRCTTLRPLYPNRP